MCKCAVVCEHCVAERVWAETTWASDQQVRACCIIAPAWFANIGFSFYPKAACLHGSQRHDGCMPFP